MRVALMQPTFMPWLGYLALADSVDLFVFLDDFQFCRRTWGHRNRLFVAPGRVDWVTAPVEHAGSEERIAYNRARVLIDAVAKKLPAMLRHAYARAPYLDLVLPRVEAWLARPYPSLAAFNIAFVRELMELYDVRAAITTSSEVGSRGTRSARLESILSAVGAKRYHAARGSVGYMVDDAVFPLSGVATYVQRYEPIAYPQVQTTRFVPYLSALDAVLQVGPEEATWVMRRGALPFEPWLEAIAS